MFMANDKVYIDFDDNKGKNAKVIISPELRVRIMEQMHNQRVHPGQRKTVNDIKKDYFWPTMSGEIKRYGMACDTCQRVQVF